MAESNPFFTPDLFAFLEDLEENNDRDWFNEPRNKKRYEASVREPSLAFIREMGPRIARVTDYLMAVDKKSGGSLMRIYRDTRFSKDKTPYKTNVGIQFRHRAGKDVHAPGLYVHLDKKEVFVGVGMWRPESKALAKIRDKIAQEHDDWFDIIDAPDFKADFEPHGDTLKRPPRGFAKDHPAIVELKRKDFIITKPLERKDALREDFPDVVEGLLVKAKPYCAFLCDAVELGF